VTQRGRHDIKVPRLAFRGRGAAADDGANPTEIGPSASTLSSNDNDSPGMHRVLGDNSGR
jgi:hypothetical protein